MTPVALLIGSILALHPGISPKKAANIATYTAKYCISPVRDTFISILSVESGLTNGKVSPQGDFGLSQVNYKAWGTRYNVTPADLLLPETNIRVGCSILNLAYVKHRDSRDWAGYYHSRHKNSRQNYVRKLNLKLEMIKNARNS